MRIIVCGGRDYADRDTVASVLRDVEIDARRRGFADGLTARGWITLVHGDARGADRLAAHVAVEMGWNIEPHPADWERHGKAAGFIRNREMAGLPADLLVVFPGGRGTGHMVDCARRYGIPVREVAR